MRSSRLNASVRRTASNTAHSLGIAPLSALANISLRGPGLLPPANIRTRWSSSAAILAAAACARARRRHSRYSRERARARRTIVFTSSGDPKQVLAYDRSRDRRPHLHRAAHARVSGRDHPHRARDVARRGFRHSADRGRTDRAEPRGRTLRRRRARQVQRAAHRREARGHQEGRRPALLQRRDAEDRPRRAEVGAGQQPERRPRVRRQDRLSGHHPSVVHAGRNRRRHCLQPRRADGDAGARPRSLSGARSADRRIGPRLERVRA